MDCAVTLALVAPVTSCEAEAIAVRCAPDRDHNEAGAEPVVWTAPDRFAWGDDCAAA